MIAGCHAHGGNDVGMRNHVGSSLPSSHQTPLGRFIERRQWWQTRPIDRQWLIGSRLPTGRVPCPRRQRRGHAESRGVITPIVASNSPRSVHRRASVVADSPYRSPVAHRLPSANWPGAMPTEATTWACGITWSHHSHRRIKLPSVGSSKGVSGGRLALSIASGSSAPVCQLAALDHGQSMARSTSPRRSGLSCT